jgi:hypothetical protein
VVFQDGPPLYLHEASQQPEKPVLLPQPIPLPADKRDRIDIPKKPF